MLDKYIVGLTFIPWILVFMVTIVKNLNDEDYKKFNFKYFKKNIFKIFRLDLLFLIVVFYYFSSYDKGFVDKYLFLVMNLYLFVNSFYDKKEIKKDFFKHNLFNLFLVFLVMLLPFLVYFIKNDLELTYKIMLSYLFLEYIIVLVINYIGRLFKRK